MWPTSGAKLVLVAPLGIYRADQPVADLWAQSPGMLPELLCEDRSNYEDLYKAPSGEDLIELKVLETRASEAAARLFWPLADTGLDKRLHRIRHATMLVWGENDRVVPKSYADIYAALIPGHAKTMTVREAGHLADLDAPQALADMVDGFLEETTRTRRDN
jgi:pimeloyl-ACP methyl ester carboxylesterase